MSRYEDVFVMAPGMWQNETGPEDWWAVATDDLGIVAYFWQEEDAILFSELDIWEKRRTNADYGS